MCCRRRRAARQAWLEQRAAGGGRCGRGFGPGSGGPPFRPPFMGGGHFGRWRDTPRNDTPDNPSQFRQVAAQNQFAARDIEKGTAPIETNAGRFSFMSDPFGRWRDSGRTDAKTDAKRESTMTLPPRYTSGVAVVPQWNDEKAAGQRESTPKN